MPNLWFGAGLIIVLVVFWVYYMQYYKIECEQMFLDDILVTSKLKTGDIILFKAYNNFNSIFHGGYFGHIGIVYIENGVPMLFEANGIERVPLLPHHSTTGIFLTPLADRIKKYKGRCFLKPLNEPLDDNIISGFREFIDYALDNMYYEYSVIKTGIKRGLGIERCSNGTNCGEIVFLSLIKLGLLPEEDYDNSAYHYLRWMSSISKLQNGYYYEDLIEIIDHPFAR